MSGPLQFTRTGYCATLWTMVCVILYVGHFKACGGIVDENIDYLAATNKKLLIISRDLFDVFIQLQSVSRRADPFISRWSAYL